VLASIHSWNARLPLRVPGFLVLLPSEEVASQSKNPRRLRPSMWIRIRAALQRCRTCSLVRMRLQALRYPTQITFQLYDLLPKRMISRGGKRPMARKKARVEQGRVRFMVREEANGTPFLCIEPEYQSIPVLEDALISLQLHSGTSLPTSRQQAQRIKDLMNDYFSGISFTMYDSHPLYAKGAKKAARKSSGRSARKAARKSPRKSAARSARTRKRAHRR